MCPTCSGTMQLLTKDDARHVRYFLCPRCGTVMMCEKNIDGDPLEQEFVPALVERCRAFAELLHLLWGIGAACEGPHSTGLSDAQNRWHRLGIAEAINTPDNRPA